MNSYYDSNKKIRFGSFFQKTSNNKNFQELKIIGVKGHRNSKRFSGQVNFGGSLKSQKDLTKLSSHKIFEMKKEEKIKDKKKKEEKEEKEKKNSFVQQNTNPHKFSFNKNKPLFPYRYYILYLFFKNINLKQKEKIFTRKFINCYSFLVNQFDVKNYLILRKQFSAMKIVLSDYQKIIESEQKININQKDFENK